MKVVMPYRFPASAQIDPRRWNENVEAMRQRQSDNLSARWAYFDLVCPFPLVSPATASDYGDYDLILPFALEITQVECFLITTVDTVTVTVSDVNAGTEIVMRPENKVYGVHTAQAAASLSLASDQVIRVSVDAGPDTATDVTVLLRCRVDATVNFTDVDLANVGASLIAADVNALFAAHDTLMDGLNVGGDASSPSSGWLSWSPELLSISPRTSLVTHTWPLLQGSRGATLDEIRVFADADGAVTFSLYGPGPTLIDSAVVVDTGSGTISNGSITGLGLGAGDLTDALLVVTSSSTLYRAYALPLFVPES